MKKINLRNYILVGLIICLVFFLTGCDNIKIGWVTTNLPGHSKAKYFYFSGNIERSFKVSAGEKVNIKYDYQVKRGDLEIKCITPNDKEIILSDKSPGNKIILIDKKGRLRIIIRGNKTKGNFDISWDVKH